MNDLKFAASGFVGRAPTMSGNSCGGFALSIVDIYKSLREWVRAPGHCNTQFIARRFSKSQFLDPASSFTLVGSRLLPAALDRYSTPPRS